MMKPNEVLTIRLSDGITRGITITLALLLAVSASGGCGRRAAPAATVEPAEAAARAIETCDANADGVLTLEECASAQGLQTVFSRYDSDGDGKLTTQEIERGIRDWSDRPDPIPVEVQVVKGQFAVANATVILEPVSFLADALPKAEGVTDGQGLTRMYASEYPFPESMQRERFMFPGLYNVQISLPNQTKQPTPVGALIDSPALASRVLKIQVSADGKAKILQSH